jgi:hypothetical protein
MMKTAAPISIDAPQLGLCSRRQHSTPRKKEAQHHCRSTARVWKLIEWKEQARMNDENELTESFLSRWMWILHLGVIAGFGLQDIRQRPRHHHHVVVNHRHLHLVEESQGAAQLEIKSRTSCGIDNFSGFLSCG